MAPAGDTVAIALRCSRDITNAEAKALPRTFQVLVRSAPVANIGAPYSKPLALWCVTETKLVGKWYGEWLINGQIVDSHG